MFAGQNSARWHAKTP